MRQRQEAATSQRSASLRRLLRHLSLGIIAGIIADDVRLLAAFVLIYLLVEAWHHLFPQPDERSIIGWGLIIGSISATLVVVSPGSSLNSATCSEAWPTEDYPIEAVAIVVAGLPNEDPAAYGPSEAVKTLFATHYADEWAVHVFGVSAPFASSAEARRQGTRCNADIVLWPLRSQAGTVSWTAEMVASEASMRLGNMSEGDATLLHNAVVDDLLSKVEMLVESTMALQAHAEDLTLADGSTGSSAMIDEIRDYNSLAGRRPVTFRVYGDWDGDGVQTPGSYQAMTGQVLFKASNVNDELYASFVRAGGSNDVPLVGDYDGDGVDTLAFYSHKSRTITVVTDPLNATELSVYAQPVASARPFVGDFDNDGIDTLGWYQPGHHLVSITNDHLQSTTILVTPTLIPSVR